jgi:outer membrane protein
MTARSKEALPVPRNRCLALFSSVLFVTAVFGPRTATLAAAPPPTTAPPPAVVRLTLEEAKQRALDASKLLSLAGMNITSKEYAIAAAKADYYPKVLGMAVYFHLDRPLGDVLTTKGRPALGIPPVAIDVNVVNRNPSTETVYVAQPITLLLKVRQAVRIAQADQQIAQAELEKGIRALSSGVEQLYWGLLAAQRIRAGILEALEGAELLAKTGSLEGRTALLETKQALQDVESQIADVTEQLNNLLDLPVCTKLDLVEPPLPILPLSCADEAVAAALATSPEIREAEQDIVKAQAATAAAKVDYLPNVAVLGGYANQNMADYIQKDITYVGVIGSVTFFEWGKRRNVIREREMFIAMAQQKLRQTQDEVRARAQKAFREVAQDQIVLKNAQELVPLRQEAVKAATVPILAMLAGKAAMQAQVDLIKADLAYRTDVAKLMSLLGH